MTSDRLKPLRAWLPHHWNFADETWTCLACGQSSWGDPCQCPCCREESNMHYQFFGKAKVNLLLDHRHDCFCTSLPGSGPRPGEERLTQPRFQKLDPLCVAGVLVSDRGEG